MSAQNSSSRQRHACFGHPACPRRGAFVLLPRCERQISRSRRAWRRRSSPGCGSLFTLCFSLALFRPWTNPGMLRARSLPLQLLRGMFLFGSTFFNFLALNTLQLAADHVDLLLCAHGDHRACRADARRMGRLAALACHCAPASSACWSLHGQALPVSRSATSMRWARCSAIPST